MGLIARMSVTVGLIEYIMVAWVSDHAGGSPWDSIEPHPTSLGLDVGHIARRRTALGPHTVIEYMISAALIWTVMITRVRVLYMVHCHLVSTKLIQVEIFP